MRIPQPTTLGRSIAGVLAHLHSSRVVLARRVLGVEKGWEPVTLATGVTVLDERPVEVRRDSGGFAHLRGTLATGPSFTGALFATPLPSRPLGAPILPHVAGHTTLWFDGGLDTDRQIVVRIHPDGTADLPTTQLSPRGDEPRPIAYPRLSFEAVSYDTRARS